MHFTAKLFVGCVLATVTALANASQSDIGAGHYREYSCEQLLDESRQIAARAGVVADDLADARLADTASAESSVVVPSVLSSPKPVSGELAVLKQKLSAIEDATTQSQCQIEFRTSGRR